MNPLRVIATAYACEPDTGSETGIGWNIIREVARHGGADLTVITRRNNRQRIEEALARDPSERLRFVYYDLPRWAAWWKRGRRGLQPYYYLWQRGAATTAARLHAEGPFDCSHHVTFGRYWSPSFLPQLGIPFVWGPVGGGESVPAGLWKSFSVTERAYEAARSAARMLGERTPAVREAAARCALAFATTRETKERLEALGVGRIGLLGNAALSQGDRDALARIPPAPDGPIRFVSVGRLLHWKGFDLGVRALASSGIPDAEYWILGDGPSRGTIERVARRVGISDRVKFTGNVARDEVISCLSLSHALIHPSMHDSGGWACIEAMAAGRPVVCLDVGGPAVMVDHASGFKIEPSDSDGVVARMADVMRLLAAKRELLGSLGAAARSRVARDFTWEAKAREIVAGYSAATARGIEFDEPILI